MDYKKYKKIVKKYHKKPSYVKNFFLAFISGGILGTSCEIFFKLIKFITNINPDNIEKLISLIIIGVTSLFTCFGTFDNLISKFRSGLIIPTTGFSHSVSSSLIDFKNEGFIKGLGSNLFSLAGSVILYSVVISFILVLIKVIL